ncbi:ABC-2 type transport system permease protein [Dysgonomonas alginatilytica]|uniref:Transport permease protein n=1 Tax=Dysgonomonas alginatilytica TaxID=1605892 RepID=A0A2V3PT56_9BACT|nr:ABC transporter permease [Dysgonomonas alginatilytica]PXV67378.1 ABC-2 type transport system permease protein [Dysgonomonas alginatilytica]
MKQFLSFVKKEFFHIFRDTRTMMIILGIPVIQMLLFGFAITTEVRNVQVAVFDPSKDISTERIINQLDASQYFHVVKMLNNPDEINAVFKENHNINLVVVFDEKFNENLLHTGEASIQLIADATDPNQATTLSGYATSIINSYQQELLQEYKIPIRIKPEMKMLYNPQIKSAYNFVPGVMGLIFMLICAMMTSISIVREKETGTMEILLASPMKPIYIIVAKAIPYFAISIINLTTILLLSIYILKVPVSGNFYSLIGISLLFIMVALSLGILISTIAETQVAAMLVSGMGMILPVMILSGMIFPIESMPVVLQWISDIIPAKWYISAVRKLMIQGLGITSVYKELAVLLGMGVFLITVSLKNFKTRLN